MNPNMPGGGRRGSLWIGPALITAVIVLIPLVRNLFVYGWDWDLRGFVAVAGFSTVLFSAGLTYQMVTKKVGTPAYRAAAAIALVAAFLLVWGNFVQAADDVNRDAMMFLWVPLVGIIGAAMARFRADGMARALFVTALAQAFVLAVLLIVRNPQVTSWTPAVLRGFGFNAFLVMLFAGSALLFRKVGRGESVPSAV
jgi:hypothetical protein